MGYFKPLRRKLGVLTLAMTCAFAAGWVRSLTVLDQFSLPTGKESVLVLGSRLQCLEWHWVYEDKKPRLRSIRRTSHTIDMEDLRTYIEDHPNVWQWRFAGVEIGAGFGFWTGAKGFTYRDIVCRVPYWSVVIPLTLLSAYLLLSKPRLTAKSQIWRLPENEAKIGFTNID